MSGTQMTKPTQAQKNTMIFNRTFARSNSIEDATELLDMLLADITDIEELADHLRFHGFIKNFDAIKLSKGQGWTVQELPAEVWERYNRGTSRFSNKGEK